MHAGLGNYHHRRAGFASATQRICKKTQIYLQMQDVAMNMSLTTKRGADQLPASNTIAASVEKERQQLKDLCLKGRAFCPSSKI